MMTILRRTTAIAALAALPLAPVAVQAQTQHDQQTGAQIQPDTENATKYGIQGEMLPDGQQAGAEGDDAQGHATQAQTQPETDGVAQDGVQDKMAPDGQQGDTQARSEGQKAGAQESQAAEQPAEGVQQSQQQGQAADQPATGAQEMQQQAEGDSGPDAIVARVGDADIMRSDVLGVIAVLPPELQQQPAEMLIPMALDQLVLRELILQKAREGGLEADPDVEAMLAGASDASDEARENAMVQVWLDRELEGAVTDQKVQETYGTIEGQLGDQVPPLDQIRPQIEQELRRLAFLELSEELHTGADVTLFGPDGEPITEGGSSTQ